jgi:hypothetical protein
MKVYCVFFMDWPESHIKCKDLIRIFKTREGAELFKENQVEPFSHDIEEWEI